jgi:hypothetical protein
MAAWICLAEASFVFVSVAIVAHPAKSKSSPFKAFRSEREIFSIPTVALISHSDFRGCEIRSVLGVCCSDARGRRRPLVYAIRAKLWGLSRENSKK